MLEIESPPRFISQTTSLLSHVAFSFSELSSYYHSLLVLVQPLEPLSPAITMSTQRFHVWYLRRDEIPALVDLAYSARLAQVVNHVIFQNRGGEETQRVQCERAVRALFDDPTAKCTIIKPEDSDEIVGFCIEKRCVNDAQVDSPSPEGPTKPAKRPRLDLRIVTGASEPELPDYPNFLQQPNSYAGADLTTSHSEVKQSSY